LLRFIVPDRHPDASKEIVKGASNGHLRLRRQESKDKLVDSGMAFVEEGNKLSSKNVIATGEKWTNLHKQFVEHI